jgi:hypothetical protein
MNIPGAAELERRVLEEANEDFYGLWECCWGLRHDFSLSQPDAELGEIIAPIMRQLVQRGWVALYRRQAGNKESRPVPMEQVDAVLADPVNWSSPPSDEHWAVWFGATDAGRAAWERP